MATCFPGSFIVSHFLLGTVNIFVYLFIFPCSFYLHYFLVHWFLFLCLASALQCWTKPECKANEGTCKETCLEDEMDVGDDFNFCLPGGLCRCCAPRGEDMRAQLRSPKQCVYRSLNPNYILLNAQISTYFYLWLIFGFLYTFLKFLGFTKISNTR